MTISGAKAHAPGGPSGWGAASISPAGEGRTVTELPFVAEAEPARAAAFHYLRAGLHPLPVCRPVPGAPGVAPAPAGAPRPR